MVESSTDSNRPVPTRRTHSAVVGGFLGLSLIGVVIPQLWGPQLRAEEIRPVPAAPVCDIHPVAAVPGTLFICGGGVMPQTIIQRFFDLAGGKDARVVVVTTASTFAGTPELHDKYAHWKNYAHTSIDFFHAPTRAEADSAEFCEKFKSATAIWFTGGNQSFLTDAYLNTHAAKMFHEVLKRGGVVGGTSAGAAIMSHAMIAGGHKEPQMATGLGFLPGTIIDQHFTNRGREERLKLAVQLRPGHVGIGIDESTALIIRGTKMEVMGDAAVTMCLSKPAEVDAMPMRLVHGQTNDLSKFSQRAIDWAKHEMLARRNPIPEVKAGTLVIVGGGQTPREAFEKFLTAAGGKDSPIIVVSDTLRDDLNEEKGVCNWLKAAGASNVRQLHARDKSELANPDIAAWLNEARGVWFTGGRESRMEAYLETSIQKLFHGVLRRGGVIGGTSAGATIQGEYFARGLSQENKPETATEGYERGFGFLSGCAIDFRDADSNDRALPHERFEDMTGMKRAHPQLVGIGIDDGTALIVRGTTMEVVGQNQVAIYDRPMSNKEPVEYDVIKAGQKYDFKQHKLMEQVVLDTK
ncbi:MAG: cyanophycinase [Planctomycetota bacterium]